MDDNNNINKDEKKTNAELLAEVKKLREETEKDNKKKWQNNAYNTMLVIGLILLAFYFFTRCSF